MEDHDEEGNGLEDEIQTENDGVDEVLDIFERFDEKRHHIL